MDDRNKATLSRIGLQSEGRFGGSEERTYSISLNGKGRWLRTCSSSVDGVVLSARMHTYVRLFIRHLGTYVKEDWPDLCDSK